MCLVHSRFHCSGADAKHCHIMISRSCYCHSLFPTLNTRMQVVPHFKWAVQCTAQLLQRSSASECSRVCCSDRQGCRGLADTLGCDQRAWADHSHKATAAARPAHSHGMPGLVWHGRPLHLPVTTPASSIPAWRSGMQASKYWHERGACDGAVSQFGCSSATTAGSQTAHSATAVHAACCPATGPKWLGDNKASWHQTV